MVNLLECQASVAVCFQAVTVLWTKALLMIRGGTRRLFAAT